jgi:hypothetical protein
MLQMKHTIRRTLLLVALTLAGSVQYRGLRAEDVSQVRILSSSDRSIAFEYHPLYTEGREVQGSRGERFFLMDFEGSRTPAYSEERIGTPDLKYKFLPLAFPGRAGHAVQVIASDYEDLANVLYAPVPALRVRDEMIEIERYGVNAEAYRTAAFLPSDVVVLGSVDQVRSMFTGGVMIHPLQYNPATRTLRKYTRLVVEVVFGPVEAGVGATQNEESLLKDVLLNYSVAKRWQIGRQQNRIVTVTPGVLAEGSWYRMTVNEEGVYRLDASYLSAAGISVAGLDPRTIKIYGNGGTEVPENVFAPRSQDLVENAIYVEGESDGRFDNGDYILFYGKGARGFTYDSPNRTVRHYINRYTESNYYWLTFGGQTGRRMEVQPSLTEPATIVPDRFLDAVAVEREQVNLLSSGKDWYGQPMIPGSSLVYSNTLADLVPDDQILYRYTLVARSNVTPSFEVREGSTLIGVHSLGTVNYTSPFTYADARTFEATGTSNLAGNSSQLSFTFRSVSIAATGWIDWLEVLFPRRLRAVSNFLRFRSLDASGVAEYQLQQFTATPFIFKVNDFANVKRITSVGATFRAAETEGTVSEYCAAGPGSFKVPAAIARMQNQNLRGFGAGGTGNDGADFIIVTSSEYRSAADRLKNYREQPAHGNLRTIVVDVNEIYNEFAGGLPDVTAIRDYLKYAYDNWVRRPEFVLFFGQASYDYKGILGTRSSYVPTWQSAQSRDDVFSYATDDFFAKFGIGNSISLVLGRMSARSGVEALTMVERLIRYEESPSKDNWKTRLLFVGDDGWTSECGECEGILHSQDVETLAEGTFAPGLRYTPDLFDRRKVYIAEYPTINTAVGRRKPGAFQAIIDEINNGVLMVTYAGHGNPTVWAHENIFNVQTSIPQLVNASRLSVFLLATCNFSQFDDPKRYTGAELLLNRTGGGAIGVISATRKVFAGENANLSREFYKRLFSIDAFGRVVVARPAKALFLVKSNGANSENDQKFCWLGDPTMWMQFPQTFALLDSINSEPVDTVNGLPRSSPLQLKALARITVHGSVRDINNRVDSTFNGRALLVVSDATRRVLVANFPPGSSWPYIAAGATIFKGQNSVRDGHFTARFIVPKDISYADSSTRGRMKAYVYNDNTDGVGFTNKIWVGGTDSTVANDITGPAIRLYLQNRSFRPGDVVTESPMLIADLQDSNGITTSSSGIGHRIEAWINNSSQSIDLTEFYSGILDSYQEGVVEYQLRDVPQGRNTLRLRAWDTFNNSSVAETYFEVSSSDRLTLKDVFNYPNPMAGGGTEFTLRVNQTTPIAVTVKIYTLAGRQIQTLESSSVGELFVRIPWDGRDRDGDIVANGVYLYKVIVKTTDGRFNSEALGKLAVAK